MFISKKQTIAYGITVIFAKMNESKAGKRKDQGKYNQFSSR